MHFRRASRTAPCAVSCSSCAVSCSNCAPSCSKKVRSAEHQTQRQATTSIPGTPNRPRDQISSFRGRSVILLKMLANKSMTSTVGQPPPESQESQAMQHLTLGAQLPRARHHQCIYHCIAHKNLNFKQSRK